MESSNLVNKFGEQLSSAQSSQDPSSPCRDHDFQSDNGAGKETRSSPIGSADERDAPNNSTGRESLAEPSSQRSINDESVSTNHRPSIYQPFVDSKQIRVLSIDPGLSNDDKLSLGPIRCTLEIVSLDDCTPAYEQMRKSLRIDAGKPTWLSFWHVWSLHPDKEHVGTSLMTEDTHAKGARFDAPVEELGKPQPRWNWGDYISLSYVWGDSSDKKEIFVNGESFTVTQNLFEALAQLRQSFEIREAYLKVWIDAICIDQDNMKEREVEVKRMDLIYSEALAVRGWIGSPRATTEFGMATTWLEGVRNLRTPDFLASIVPSSEVAHSLTTLAAALSYEPYWERLWIMQEIALASSLVFWYGRWRFTTMDIQNLLFVVERDGILQSFPQESSELGVVDVLVQFSKRMASVFARLAILRQIRREKIFQSAPMPLIEILGLAQSARAKDPRDKVYGILAILPKKNSTRVQPDYSPSTNDQKTYTVFTQICLQEEGNLNTLERFVRRPSSQLGNMPSWAFNLSTDVYMYEKSGFFRMSDGKLQADKGRKGVLGFLQDNRTLLCDGILVDTIASLGAALYKPSNDQMISMTIEPPIKSSVFHEGPFHMPVDDRVRLALARVFCQNSAYNFADGPSLLDVPWVTEEDLELLHPETARGTVKKDTNDTDAGKKWPTFVETAYGDAIFRTLLHPNATFDVKGVGLRHYFTSGDEFCLSPQAYPDMSESVSNIVTCRRLCTTTDGLLGTVPNHARLGDRVAVLFGCDIPVILRPRGEKFEFLGGCFVEGWMKGEAIEKLDQGHLQVERIALC